MIFVLTDNRPWYKQVISGVFLSICVLITTVLVLWISIAIWYYASQDLKYFFGSIGAAVAIVMGLFSLGLIWEWSKN